MMNFRQYTSMTKCVIPNGVRLSNTSFYEAFNNMQQLKNCVISNKVSDKVTNMA